MRKICSDNRDHLYQLSLATIATWHDSKFYVPLNGMHGSSPGLAINQNAIRYAVVFRRTRKMTTEKTVLTRHRQYARQNAQTTLGHLKIPG